MFKIKKILIIFILCFFIFIPKASAKYVFSSEVNVEFQIEDVTPDYTNQIDFYIYNLQDLLNFRNLQNNKIVNFKDKNVYLMNDIDLSELYTDEIKSWIPISSEDNPFEGNFYGNFHNIYNLRIDADENTQGFFGKNNGNITKLNVYGQINANDSINIGGIAGINSGEISYSNSNVTVFGSSSKVGGIAGYCNNGKITYCKNYCEINGDCYIGGICGYAKKSYFWRCGNLETAIINCYSECCGGIVRIC